jgi:hypothetical protein
MFAILARHSGLKLALADEVKVLISGACLEALYLLDVQLLRVLRWCPVLVVEHAKGVLLLNRCC